MTDSLSQFAADILSGRIRIIDLTQTLSPEMPTIVLPPEVGQCAPFRLEEISRYDGRGPAWYWNNFTCGEHTGTHFDAPIHWVSGRDLPNNAVDTIAVSNFIAPAVVIDCSGEAAADEDFTLTVEFLQAWEARHGRIPNRCWVLMRTDWSKRDPVAYANLRSDGAHNPGPAPEAVKWLVEERDVHGF
ncbi:MAG: cyclase family protein, partial [Xanthobacteraceae bacterium]